MCKGDCKEFCWTLFVFLLWLSIKQLAFLWSWVHQLQFCWVPLYWGNWFPVKPRVCVTVWWATPPPTFCKGSRFRLDQAATSLENKMTWWHISPVVLAEESYQTSCSWNQGRAGGHGLPEDVSEHTACLGRGAACMTDPLLAAAPWRARCSEAEPFGCWDNSTVYKILMPPLKQQTSLVIRNICTGNM